MMLLEIAYLIGVADVLWLALSRYENIVSDRRWRHRWQTDVVLAVMIASWPLAAVGALYFWWRAK